MKIYKIITSPECLVSSFPTHMAPDLILTKHLFQEAGSKLLLHLRNPLSLSLTVFQEHFAERERSPFSLSLFSCFSKLPLNKMRDRGFIQQTFTTTKRRQDLEEGDRTCLKGRCGTSRPLLSDGSVNILIQGFALSVRISHSGYHSTVEEGCGLSNIPIKCSVVNRQLNICSSRWDIFITNTLHFQF